MKTRIGVFICDCGGSIKNIDFSAVREKVATISDVALVNLSSALCLKEGIDGMSSSIREGNMERVVVAACSPDLKEPVFQQALERAGLNSHLLSMANIREQCSWAHEGDVSEKALQLIRMAVERARLLQPREKKELPVNQQVLVVGGGFSGMSSAIQFSRVGLRTILLERESALGGRNRGLEDLYGFETNSIVKAIEQDKNIEILPSSEVVGIEGRTGNFTVRIRKGKEEISRVLGSIVFATGYEARVAALDFELKAGVNITSQDGLVQMLRDSNVERRPRTVCFVFDFSDESSHFSSLATLNNALAVKQRWGSEVYVFCKNVKVDSEGAEKLYREARERGVVFLKFAEKPKLLAKDGRVKLEAKDVLLGENITLDPDLLVAEEKFLPALGTDSLSSLLNVGIDSRGFYQNENVHLYPVASERKGIFFVGGCRGDLGLSRALTDIRSVVTRIYDLLSSGKMVAELEKVKVDPQKCRTCLTCIRVCPHSAIQLARSDNGREVAGISDLDCEGCGTCAAICPAKAIEFEGYTDQQILAQIEVIGAS